MLTKMNAWLILGWIVALAGPMAFRSASRSTGNADSPAIDTVPTRKERWEPGTRDRLQMRFSSSGTLHAFEPGQQDYGITASLKGAATATVLSKSSASGVEVPVHWLFEPSEFTAQIEADTPKVNYGNQVWQLAAQYTRSGTLIGVDTPGGMPPLARHVIVDFLRATQFSFADDAETSESGRIKAKWVVNEQDSDGPYEADYSVQPGNSDHFHMLKKKIRKENAVVCLCRFESSGWSVNWPQTVSLEERTQLVSAGQMVAESTRSASWESIGLGNVASLEVSALLSATSKFSSSTQLERSDTEARLKSVSRGVLDTDNWDSLYSKMALLHQGAQIDRAVLARKFVALLRLEPSVSQNYLEVLRSAEANSFELHSLAAALVEVGSPSAQVALRLAIDARKSDPRVCFTLMADAAQLTMPSAETVGFWREVVLQDPNAESGRIAGLALGAAAKHLSGTTSDAASLTQPFRAELLTSTNPGRTVYLLDVLGNGGQPEDLPTLIRFAGHPSSRIRREAILAMRFQKGARPQEVLVDHLLTDADPDVRRAAAKALGFQGLSQATIQAMMTAVKKDSDPSSRRELLAGLWSHRNSVGEVVPFLKEVARTHPSEKTRNHARQLLNSSTNTQIFKS